MKEVTRKILSVTLVLLALIFLFLCIVLPIFQLFNTRIYMVPFFIVCAASCFAVFNPERTTTRVFGLISIAMGLLSLWISGFYTPIIGIASIAFFVGIIMISKKSLLIKKHNIPLTITIVIVSVIAIMFQIKFIYSFFDLYTQVISGKLNAPMHVAEDSLKIAFDGIGLLITLMCVIFSLIAVYITPCGNIKQKETQDQYSD